MSKDPLLQKDSVIPASRLAKFDHSKVEYRSPVLKDPFPTSPLIKKMAFWRLHSEAERRAMGDKIRSLSAPGTQAVVVHIAMDCVEELHQHIVNPEKPYLRLSMPLERPVSDLVQQVRQKLLKDELPPRAGIFLYTLGSSAPQSTMAISLNDALEQYTARALRPDDGMLHFVVTIEAVFG